MTDWVRFLEVHGPAETITELLALAGEGPEHQAWNWLYSTARDSQADYAACHAALPALTGIARGFSPVDRWGPLGIASGIVSFFDRPDDVPDPLIVCPAEVEELRKLTTETLSDPEGISGDSACYYNMLIFLLGFEGIDIESENLHHLPAPESQIRCPHCQAENFIVYGDPGFFSTQYWEVWDPDIEKSPLLPVAPASLPRIAKQIHDRVLADGHPDIAAMLTHAFGSTHCGNCERLVDSVIENVV